MRALEDGDSSEDYSSSSESSDPSPHLRRMHRREDSEDSEDSGDSDDSEDQSMGGGRAGKDHFQEEAEEEEEEQSLMSSHHSSSSSEKQTPPPLPINFASSSGAAGGLSPPPLPSHASKPSHQESSSSSRTPGPRKSRRLEQELQELEDRMKAKFTAGSGGGSNSGSNHSNRNSLAGGAGGAGDHPPPPIPRTSTMSGISRSPTTSQGFRSNNPSSVSPLQQGRTMGTSNRNHPSLNGSSSSFPRPPAGSLPTPPKPWTTQVHPESNVVYFHNPETGASQWHFPSEQKDERKKKQKKKEEKKSEERKAKSESLQTEITEATKEENRAASLFSQHARDEETFRALQKVWEDKATEHRQRADLLGKDLDGLAVEERLEEALQLLRSVESARKEADKQSSLALKATEQRFKAGVQLAKARRRRSEAERKLQLLKEEEDLEHFQQQQQQQQQFPLQRHSSSGSLQSLRRSSAENSPHSSFHRLDDHRNYPQQSPQQHHPQYHHPQHHPQHQYSHSQIYGSQEFSNPSSPRQQFHPHPQHPQHPHHGSPTSSSPASASAVHHHHQQQQSSPARLHVIEKMIKGLPEGSELRMENGNLIVYKDGQWLGDIKVDDVQALEAELGGMAPAAGMNLIPDETTKGLALASVIPGGAAAFAGLSPGEVITHIDDAKVQDEQTFREIWNRVRPGDLLRLVILRCLQPGTRRYSRRTVSMCVGAKGHSIEEVQALCVLIAKAKGFQIPQFPPRQQPRGSPGSPSVMASSHNLRDYRK